MEYSSTRTNNLQKPLFCSGQVVTDDDVYSCFEPMKDKAIVSVLEATE